MKKEREECKKVKKLLTAHRAPHHDDHDTTTTADANQ